VNEPKLPLWRLIAGLAVLALFAAVLIALAPVYIENYRLARYVHSLAAAPASQTTPDESLRAQVIAEAHQLDLPVAPGDVHISHSGGRVQLQAAYRVQMNLSLYRVDLHMSAH
jgi:Domain of unknown function (DUF4845)